MWFGLENQNKIVWYGLETHWQISRQDCVIIYTERIILNDEEYIASWKCRYHFRHPVQIVVTEVPPLPHDAMEIRHMLLFQSFTHWDGADNQSPSTTQGSIQSKWNLIHTICKKIWTLKIYVYIYSSFRKRFEIPGPLSYQMINPPLLLVN